MAGRKTRGIPDPGVARCVVSWEDTGRDGTRRESMNQRAMLRGVGAVAVLAGLAGSASALPINGRVRVFTYTVDPNGNAAAPADPGIGPDFQFANLIWNQVGISFLNDGNQTIAVNTPAVAAGWNRVSFNNTLNT